jgi:hypothetical protein
MIVAVCCFEMMKCRTKGERERGKETVASEIHANVESSSATCRSEHQRHSNFSSGDKVCGR